MHAKVFSNVVNVSLLIGFRFEDIFDALENLNEELTIETSNSRCSLVYSNTKLRIPSWVSYTGHDGKSSAATDVVGDVRHLGEKSANIFSQGTLTRPNGRGTTYV